MSARKLFLLLIALVIAGGTFQFARTFLSAPEPAPAAPVSADAPPPAPSYQILVAASDLPMGTLVAPDHLRWQLWPEGQGAPDAYVSDQGHAIEEFSGAVVRQGLRAGDPITPGRLVKRGERGFLAAVLTPGMRAVTVPITSVTGLAGLVFPGDRVDVILTHTIQQPDAAAVSIRRASETVLTNIRVLAIDQRVDDQTPQPTVGELATLEVAPSDAELVTLVSEIGQLSLSLRSLVPAPEADPAASLIAAIDYKSHSAGQTVLDPTTGGIGFTWDSDVSALLPPPPVASAAPSRTVQVMRGGTPAEPKIFD